nr:TPA_asm: polymerase [Citrullus ophiovirus]
MDFSEETTFISSKDDMDTSITSEVTRSDNGLHESTTTFLEREPMHVSPDKHIKKEYHRLLKSAMDNNHFFFFKFLESKETEFYDLSMAKESEKSLEPKKPEFDFQSTLIYWEGGKDEGRMRQYIDKPALISRLNNPYKIISKSNLNQFVFRKDYPEKFSLRSKIDLMRLRDAISPMSRSDVLKIKQGTEDEILNFINWIKVLGNKSNKMNTLLKFSKSLAEHEYEKNKASLMSHVDLSIGRKTTTEIEPSIETQKLMWMVNLLDTINLKTKISYSCLSNKGTGYQNSHKFHENRKIDTVIFLDGSSLHRVTVRSALCDLVIEFEMFISKTFTYITNQDNEVVIGDSAMLNYLMTNLENDMVINICKDLNKSSNINLEDNVFIDYIISLKELKTKDRVEMTALYEATCLLMSDMKGVSSTLPLLDNLLDSYQVSPKHTEKLMRICTEAQGYTCVKMSCLGKLHTVAEVSENEGLRKYAQRTNRDHNVVKESVERLRRLFRMRVVTTYVRKYGVVPELLNSSYTLMQELTLMAAGGSFNNDIISNPAQYANVRLGQMLRPGNETNITSRIIDKACTKDKYSPEGNSIKELIYYVTQNDLESLINEVKIERQTEGWKEENRRLFIKERKDPSLFNLTESFIVRLVEKEKELKTEARFYGVASFKLKIYISIVMEMIKRAMKLIPGQMMTMTEDERRQIMHKMSCVLDEPDSYSIFLDYSGHNTSQRPENTEFIVEEVADMYGFALESPERKNFTSIVHLFNKIDVIYEHLFSDYVFVSKHQRGAIEGWFGPIWGIQSQLMMEDMLTSIGFTKYIGTTYSDDSCGVFTKKGLNEKSLNDIIRYIQDYAMKMGLIVKLSQTQVTSRRCSMLKTHYFDDRPVDTFYKRILAISPNSDILWGDDIEKISTIDSGYTSSTTRSDQVFDQMVVRNLRYLMVVEKELIKWSKFMEVELDRRTFECKHSMLVLAKLCLEKCEKLESIVEADIPDENEFTTNFFRFNEKNVDLLEAVMMNMYLPYATYGYSMTPLPNTMISGFSYSNVKRLCYVYSIISDKKKRIMRSLINLSTTARAYIKEPFPMVGGRFDTKTLLSDELKKILPSKVDNKELKELLMLNSEDDRNIFEIILLQTLQKKFSHRIASKFAESTLFDYVDSITSKIDNSTTLSFFVGKKKMNKLWNKAWTKNHNIVYKRNEEPVMIYDGIFDYLVQKRDNTEKFFRLNGKSHQINLNFLKIEEIPIIGCLTVDPLGPIKPVIRSNLVIDNTRTKKRLGGPARSQFNLAKFDRDVEIEGMFQNKLIFQCYEIVRYTKWIIMDLNKFSECSKETESSLISLCNLTMQTFSDCRFDDISDSVVAPIGGRFFHRALSANFNPKTGDLTSNINSNKVEVTGINSVVENNGGEDNNINVALLITYLKVLLGELRIENNLTSRLNLNQDIRNYCRDVSFNLEGIEDATKFSPLIRNLKESSRKIINTDAQNILKKSSLYRSYSLYVSSDEEIKTKFLDHKTYVPQRVIDDISSFQNLKKYMEDQELLTPDQITDSDMRKITGGIGGGRLRENFCERFYSYYRSMNIIGNESRTKSVMRSMMNHEIFSSELKKNSGMKSEFDELGYSFKYRNSLLKIFIIASCLVFKIVEKDEDTLEIQILKDKTKMNAHVNLKRLRKGQAHFNIKDKAISNLLLMALPTLGYTHEEMYIAVNEIYQSYNGREFSPDLVLSYYSSEIKNYITEASDNDGNIEYGDITYTEMELRKETMEDPISVRAAVRGFEMICALHCKPQHVSSPTMSDVYPSSVGLINHLMNTHVITAETKVCDMFGGRGDLHYCLYSKGIDHTSISRNDGYNLINRFPGMKEVKSSIDMTMKEHYENYLDHDLFILDVSHFSGKETNIITMIHDIMDLKKDIVIRLNSIAAYNFTSILEQAEKLEHKVSALVPSIESPGYIYLSIVTNKNGVAMSKCSSNYENCEETLEEIRTERRIKKSFADEVFTEKLTNEILKLSKRSLFQSAIVNSIDHTHEMISDEQLISVMTEENEKDDPSTVSFETKIQNGRKIGEMAVVELEDHVLDGLIEKVENTTTIHISKPEIEINNKGGIGNFGIIKSILAQEFLRKNLEPSITITSSLAKRMKSGRFVVGLATNSSRDIKLISEAIIDSRWIDRSSYITWKTINQLIRTSPSNETSFSEIMQSIEVGVKYKTGIRSLDKTKRIVRLVIMGLKSKKLPEILMRLLGLKVKNTRLVMKNKTQSQKYDCLNFKLLLNRILKIIKTMDIEIKGSVSGREIVREIMMLSRNTSRSRSYEEMKEDIAEGNAKTESTYDEEVAMLKEIAGFNSLSEYLETLDDNELFNGLITGIRGNVITELSGEMNVAKDQLAELPVTEECVKEELKDVISSFLGLDPEFTQINQNMSLEDMIKEQEGYDDDFIDDDY